MAEIAKLQGLEPSEIASVAGIASDSITSVNSILWPAGSYVLTIDVNSGNGSVWPYTGYEYLPDDETGVVATPDLGWSFVNWIGDTSNIVNADASSTNLIPDLHDDTEIYANFEKTDYTLTIDVVAGAGSVSPVTGTTYNYDTGLAIEATPDGGGLFTGWTGETSKIISLSDPTTNLVSPLYSNATIHANFMGDSGTLIFHSDADVTLRRTTYGSYTFYSTIDYVIVGANTSYGFSSMVHFSNLNLPGGIVIEQVWVEVVGYTNRSETPDYGIYESFTLEDSPNPTIPVSVADYRSRRTNCGIGYAYLFPRPWVRNTEYLMTMWYDNPWYGVSDSLRDCLQYLVDTYGGVASINLICEGPAPTGYNSTIRDWYSINGDPSKKTKIRIAYHLE